ncbi:MULTISPECIES: LytR/AlgR family response regulator transcription factor [unclassified Pedobacter]|uniref:LytR/AlgR family response regulator transcription factor n=1 Tax=unclassified Pedobacter TaxID=2628915 RepID=UPI00141E2953|nr:MULTISPECIES: LytTR family DNA-binding domain-containing protein [unclassified Pedobacter]NII83517.1 DNA-binding LytR/AlgR family response regulator [Pedobacter sp. SG908]NMN37381.1 DNA-binding LytR/AlgR family response regulator [Pedobacter sp. SG918]
MMYSCLIVDDNEIERDAIEMHLKKIPSLNIIAVCSNGIEASQILSTTSVDIVYSDIDMPELSGMDLLKSLKKQPLFIFITSFSEYAAESFNLDALDFIVKPATFERILKATNKAIEYIELRKQVNKLPAENLNDYDKKDDDYFFFRETKGITKLKYNDVIYIESMGDFSKLFTSIDKHVILVSLKNLEKQLPSKIFSRVHKQYIININHIATLTNHEVHLDHNFLVPISATNRQELLEKSIDKKILSRFLK